MCMCARVYLPTYNVYTYAAGDIWPVAVGTQLAAVATANVLLAVDAEAEYGQVQIES